MRTTNRLIESSEYVHFRSSVPLRNICVDNSKGESWKVYDAGPKIIRSPVIFLPPTCGTADIYFRQLVYLSSIGYRAIAVESPCSYWTVNEWCLGFKLLLDHLRLEKVHLFGASLGGFLAQKFVEFTYQCPRVISLFLCNTFIDTEIFDLTETSSLFWLLPTVFLKRLIMPSLITKSFDPDIIAAVDFVSERVKSLTQADFASRLTINCSASRVHIENMRGVRAITIMDVFDEYALSSPIREEIYELYPYAKLAQLKNGGNFPYLSKFEEVNIHINIHLRKFETETCSPRLIQTEAVHD
ncbi:hypothetical protein PGB90_008840 [Kerria lacca]